MRRDISGGPKCALGDGNEAVIQSLALDAPGDRAERRSVLVSSRNGLGTLDQGIIGMPLGLPDRGRDRGGDKCGEQYGAATSSADQRRPSVECNATMSTAIPPGVSSEV